MKEPLSKTFSSFAINFFEENLNCALFPPSLKSIEKQVIFRPLQGIFLLQPHHATPKYLKQSKLTTFNLK